MSRSSRHRQLRSRKGSMLTMTLMCVGLLLAACIIGFALYMMLTQQKRGQAEADRTAMAIVQQMNEGNRIGQMNELVARSRELVYVSRLTAGTTDNSFLYFASPLAYQLLDEATTSAVAVDKERKNQVSIIQKTIKATAEQYNMRQTTKPIFVLPWWQSYAMNVSQVNVGSLNGIQSNVEHTEIYDDLMEMDRRAKYFQPQSNLYLANINAKLPAPDNNLDFKFSSLPAPVERFVSPARLANPEIFHYLGMVVKDQKYLADPIDQIPSAVQVVGVQDFSLKNSRDTVMIGSTAMTNGANASSDRPDPNAVTNANSGKEWGRTFEKNY